MSSSGPARSNHSCYLQRHSLTVLETQMTRILLPCQGEFMAMGTEPRNEASLT